MIFDHIEKYITQADLARALTKLRKKPVSRERVQGWKRNNRVPELKGMRDDVHKVLRKRFNMRGQRYSKPVEFLRGKRKGE